MPYVIRTTPRAYVDIDAAVTWIGRRSSIAAARWHAGLQTALHSLQTNAKQYPLADEAADLGLELRELLYGRRRSIYRILFTIEEQTVNVLRVRHAAQNRLIAGDV